MTKKDKVLMVVTATIFVATWLLASYFDWCVAMHIS